MLFFVRKLSYPLLSFHRQRILPSIRKRLERFWSSKTTPTFLNQERGKL